MTCSQIDGKNYVTFLSKRGVASAIILSQQEQQNDHYYYNNNGSDSSGNSIIIKNMFLLLLSFDTGIDADYVILKKILPLITDNKDYFL
jgi:hypothetical protein